MLRLKGVPTLGYLLCGVVAVVLDAPCAIRATLDEVGVNCLPMEIVWAVPMWDGKDIGLDMCQVHRPRIAHYLVFTIKCRVLACRRWL
ncbi:hypothetical protein CPC08DRAFT_438146 [Agrocybe pediades]|nr:hypothetical protein CPC08DRAFT_438146 [Agrocybe pediades]